MLGFLLESSTCPAREESRSERGRKVKVSITRVSLAERLGAKVKLSCPGRESRIQQALERDWSAVKKCLATSKSPFPT
jgi:hypothetical protein